jgi:hypothetical protein
MMTFAYLSARYLLFANAYPSTGYLRYAKTGNLPRLTGRSPSDPRERKPLLPHSIHRRKCLYMFPSSHTHTQTGMTRAIGGRDPGRGGGELNPDQPWSHGSEYHDERASSCKGIVHEYRTWVLWQKRSGLSTQQDVKSPDFVKPRLWPRLINHGTELPDLVSLKGGFLNLSC